MTAHPKRKKSKSRAKARLSHNAVTPPALVECPQCHSAMAPHRACPTCGTYNGRQVIDVEEKKRATA